MNAMKKDFDEIVKLCEEKVEEYGERASYFMEPATEEEILDWENKTGIKMPEDYKQWLKFAKACQMCQTIASLIFPSDKQPEFLPNEYVLIGYVVGDGEVLCFSKNTGKYVTYFEGKVNEQYDDFKMVLVKIKKDITGELPEISFTEDRLNRMLARLEARRNKEKVDR